MSHYTVAVFTEPKGKSVYELLAPFDENIEMERFVQFTKQELIDLGKAEIKKYETEGCYAEYLKNPAEYESKWASNLGHLDYVKNEFPEKLKWTDEQIYLEKIQYYEEDEIGKDGEVYSTYNPNSEWDWYQIGGRWINSLKLKDGALGIHGEQSLLAPLEEVVGNKVDSAFVKDIDWEDEMMKDFATYAVITADGEWYSKGQMGWWGMSSETENEAEEWRNSFKEKFIDTAGAKTAITIVDCHI